ncbi:S1 family peptidase [Mycolicibacter virginiensis]|uniref:S1 family peptidase n=1 Tax=Mycolicibacter virginiensis TaxID=1795032 RepID=UPI001F045D84|nr:S1 family peptidase [Mycolicibacter virginiensis]ULP45921.1 S1 family peptidase [Mycolicibacter virginiensis]
MISRAAVSVAAALAAAAVTALSAGCSATVAGEARPSSELKAAALEDVAPVADQRVWVDVTGQGVSMPRDSLVGTQYSSSPRPGATITHDTVDGRTVGCTVGPAITAGDRQGFLTAGHCAMNATGPQQLTGPDGMPAHDLGVAVDAADSDGIPDPATGYADDSAVIWTPTGARASILAGTWPVAGTLMASEVRDLPMKTPICFYGAVTGIACGPLLSATDPGGVHFARTAKGGDSGAAAFVVDADGSAWLIGIMASSDDHRLASTATYLAPALDRLGAEAITAR